MKVDNFSSCLYTTNGLSYVASLWPGLTQMRAWPRYAVKTDEHALCEYPGQLSSLAYELTREHLELDQNGEICLPEGPGLGITPDPAAIKKYLVDTQVIVNGQVLYQTPGL